MNNLKLIAEKKLKTPFGPPSDCYICGKLGDADVYFLPRHGKSHRLLPSEINHKANIFGFKTLGVERVLSISAVGSLREKMRPRDVVLPDQYFDRTKKALEHTFFGNGVVAHISFAEPTCPEMRKIIASAAEKIIRKNKMKIKLHKAGTYVNMEGPAFSTRAESLVYRNMGFDVIGMTSLAEAKLCREAEICYQSIAMVTDYDCWKESEEAVSVEMLVKNLMANSDLAKLIIGEVVLSLPEKRKCGCANCLKNAILTSPENISRKNIDRLGPIIGKYIKRR